MSIISKDISKAIAILNSEELVAIPTETVYGLAGNIFSEKAINRIFSTKKRPLFNPLIVHIPSANLLHSIASYVPEKAKRLADAFWPGPLTLVLPKQSTIPDLITAGKPTVAVRVPNHKLTLELLEKLEFPLAAPSANPFGSISPTTAQHVNDYFEHDIQMVLDGGYCQRGIESTIIGFEGEEPVVFRLGSTSLEAIEAIVGSVVVKNKKEIAPDAPGMLDRHYAPLTKTILTDNLLQAIELNNDKKIGVLAFKNQIISEHVIFQLVLSEQGDTVEAASNLYEALHKLDKQDLDLIIAERLPEFELGKSVNDRLQRATVR
ncbi:L-threonylcarbamoyladenylate synthase [Psychroserpens sp.]|uniref:L-threonylcarbamoyladenylate synthase n=1 Tax=Psychroserpens sp. TaxID=2020870 RepID=UPI001B0FE09F|nr:L-threonylcarbamoyladenylate synthase [Psychroserpens sp.]MBO6607801.1 threonylcarbamoyl-AMP synthase [Psychroserpens sp.]MBO6654792.1 threonylcarbamoyl-AMP synthase [Psychroserpens sp.]MBO6682784.1 threonylcarbamoyl-AMP synthase [Psychroserpens sp.]MBO6751159.1 threonylcarbamoyl-AMP synthase [Psychroserpens sp.]MBO6916272.1 threonylcarbamoyl-AMP synthase [Psychroserpens sp.]